MVLKIVNKEPTSVELWLEPDSLGSVALKSKVGDTIRTELLISESLHTCILTHGNLIFAPNSEDNSNVILI